MRRYFYVYEKTLSVINKKNINYSTLPWSEFDRLFLFCWHFVKLFAYQLMFSTTIMLTDVLDIDGILFQYKIALGQHYNFRNIRIIQYKLMTSL